MIQIPSRARVCFGCQAPFTQGDNYASRLSKKGDRCDFCFVCWDKEKERGLALWKGQVPKKTAIEERTDRLERALELLKEAESDPKEAFLIALFLQRKKWLSLKAEYRDRLLYEVVATEEMIEISKVSLSAADTFLQQSIAEKLC